ncbi:MAG: Z1 domain-containing protein [Dehalococcoides mccartyi]|uniref:Z1 domain-containing protein n=1 Tax=Dehalococcoides mccartyi TaxID=61435 RepID=UPI0030F5A3C7
MKKLTIAEISDRVALDLRQKTVGTPTEEDLKESIDETARVLEFLSGQILTNEEKDKIKTVLLDKLVIHMDTGVMIVDEETYKPWLANRKADIDEYYWTRYCRYLSEEKGWADKVVETLDSVGDDILDLLGNPADPSIWRRKGLILGDIQSGKTSTYLALINKAADAGYKLIILLSGTIEALRKQTQERMDEGFVGLNSRNALNKDVEKKYIGVGQFDKRRTAFPLTDIISDFDVKKLQTLNFNAKSLNEPIVFVIKKNTTILKNLLAWINNSYKDTNSERIASPLLLIDDEADNASVNTEKPELDPTAVNLSIRKILDLFQHSTYVAVTATPFANIFINPDDDETMRDLFPSDFIYALSPPPYYIGSNMIFGEDASYADNVEIITDADNIFSSKDRSSHRVTELPLSLKRAINYFVLCNVVRDTRGITNDHRSMLVNINPYTLPQETTYDLIDLYVDKLQKDIKAYSKLPMTKAVKNKTINSLSELWEQTNLTTKCGKIFPDVLPHLTESALPIRVTMVNTKTRSRGLEKLDYKPYEENGYRVIVVGGNSLSRGITLEGLCVSYFYRESKMYDTLLQMGRWFGYHPGYQDIFKIWMGERTIEWFAFINHACDELKSEIAYMNKLNQTPREFGLKVLEHPDTLMITAQNKMRTAKPLERWISLSGKLVETPWLTKKTIEYNYNHTVVFVKNILSGYKEVQERLYQGIPCESVADYVSNFASHPGHLVFNAREIGDYIKKNEGSLGNWYVYFANGGEKIPTNIDGLSVLRTKRKMLLVNNDCIRVSGNKSRVGSVGTTKVTLTEKDQAAAFYEYRDEVIKKGEYKEDGKITVPDHVYLRYAKNPLLIIYFMVCNPTQDDQSSYTELRDKTIIGLGLGFPRTNTREEKIYYKINLIEQNNNLPFILDTEFEGDENYED